MSNFYRTDEYEHTTTQIRKSRSELEQEFSKLMSKKSTTREDIMNGMQASLNKPSTVDEKVTELAQRAGLEDYLAVVRKDFIDQINRTAQGIAPTQQQPKSFLDIQYVRDIIDRNYKNFHQIPPILKLIEQWRNQNPNEVPDSLKNVILTNDKELNEYINSKVDPNRPNSNITQVPNQNQQSAMDEKPPALESVEPKT